MNTFTTRARIRQSELSRQRAYRSTDGRWKLIEVRSLVGLGDYWLLVRVLESGEYVAARHRTRAAAERTFAKLNRRIEGSRATRYRELQRLVTAGHQPRSQAGGPTPANQCDLSRLVSGSLSQVRETQRGLLED